MRSYKIIIFPIGEHDIAGNKRLSNLKTYLSTIDNTSVKIVKIKKERSNNSNSVLIKYLLRFIFIFFDNCRVIFILFQERERNHINILYFYEGNHLLIHRILLSKILGYKILIDLVENPDCVSYVKSFTQKIRSAYFLFLYRFLPFITDGVVVVSRYLENKVAGDFKGKIPVLHMSVSYDPENFNSEANVYNQFGIFYGGSYGDNYDFDSLISAFNSIGKDFPGTKLYLSGNILASKLESIRNKISNKEDLIYLGYLSEEEYYKVICGMDIV